MLVRRSYGLLGDTWKFLRDLVCRPHVVNMGWDVRWSDTDEKLLQATFGLFQRFLETEWNAWVETRGCTEEIQNEVARLAWWWTNIRPFRTDGNNTIPAPKLEWLEGTRTTEPTTESATAYNRWFEAHTNSAILTELWYEEDTAMMQRLIAVRQHLWT